MQFLLRGRRVPSSLQSAMIVLLAEVIEGDLLHLAGIWLGKVRDGVKEGTSGLHPPLRAKHRVSYLRAELQSSELLLQCLCFAFEYGIDAVFLEVATGANRRLALEVLSRHLWSVSYAH